MYAVLAYYLAQRDAVDAYVAEHAAISEQARLAHEARFDPTGIRARLLAWKAADEHLLGELGCPALTSDRSHETEGRQ
jgi:hypothetical protein